MYELSFSCGPKFVFLHLTFCTQLVSDSDHPLDKIIKKHNLDDSLWILNFYKTMPDFANNFEFAAERI